MCHKTIIVPVIKFEVLEFSLYYQKIFFYLTWCIWKNCKSPKTTSIICSISKECEDRDRSITEFNLREKQLKQEIQSLYDQIDDCQARERTYTNESFRSRLGNLLIR